jgi:hypothetical protein
MPAIDELVIRNGDDLAVAAASLGPKWFKKLAVFGWTHAERGLTEADVAQVAKALGKRKLPKLDLTGTKVPLALREALTKVCVELIAPTIQIAEDQTIFIEHTNKPEWGRGKIVRKNEGKIEVQFKKPIGLKVFKADAPFLKLLA